MLGKTVRNWGKEIDRAKYQHISPIDRQRGREIRKERKMEDKMRKMAAKMKKENHQ